MACHHDAVTEPDFPLAGLAIAAIEWAAGGRGQQLVDAAAVALVNGIDSPTLRVLAGAPSVHADEEARLLGPDVFIELGLAVEDRLSCPAIIRGAQLAASQFVHSDKQNPRSLARKLRRMYEQADYPSDLAGWAGADEDYALLDDGICKDCERELDEDVLRLAQALADSAPLPEVLAPVGAVEDSAVSSSHPIQDGSTKIRIGVVGQIVRGAEEGRFVEILDDAENTSGYLIVTYADSDRSPVAFDAWVESIADVELYFEESDWQVKWPGPRGDPDGIPKGCPAK